MSKRILCFGEPLLRYQSIGESFFNDKHHIKIYPGGSEANTAVRLAKLGLEASFASVGPNNELTQSYLEILKKKDVDVSKFIFSGDRLGNYFLLSGNGLTKGEVIYDRKYSSFSQLRKGDISWDDLLEGCTWLHWTALTPALNQNLVVLLEEGLEVAVAKGIPISVDLNYRSKLWKYGKDPIHIMPGLVQYCDLILGNIWAANRMLGTSAVGEINIETEKSKVLDFASHVADEVFSRFPRTKLMANTFRFMDTPSHNLLYGTAHSRAENQLSEVRETHALVDRIGSGDAFMAGIITGYIQNYSLQNIIDLGVEEGFQKLFIEGDF